MPNLVQTVDSLQVNSVPAISSVRTRQTQNKQATDESTRNLPKDTVKISAQSQILALKQRGATATEIAAKLGLSVTDVNAALTPSSTTYGPETTVLAALSGKRAKAAPPGTKREPTSQR